MARIERGEGVSLYVARDRRLWRPWRWWLFEPGSAFPAVDGWAWTRGRAIAHGRIARALRIAGAEAGVSDKSTIEWTEASWNPVTGCVEVSPGCDHCYAKTFAERWRGVPGHAYEQGFDLTLRPERLDQPLRWKRPRRIFVNSMSDLFHADVPDEYIARVFGVMAAARQHTFQLLTKRHARMRSLLSAESFREQVFLSNNADQGDVLGDGWPLPNVWLGVSVENQQWANIRIPALLDTPAAVRWISAEPLLGSVDLRDCNGVDTIEQDWIGGPLGGSGAPHPFVDWVVVGGESGPGARPMHPDWARSLRDQCTSAGVPFFFKQWGAWEPIGPLYGEDDETDDAHMEAVAIEVIERRQVVQLESAGYIADGHQPGDPRTWLMAKAGKKAAGRVLDYRTWDEYPHAAVA